MFLCAVHAVLERIPTCCTEFGCCQLISNQFWGQRSLRTCKTQCPGNDSKQANKGCKSSAEASDRTTAKVVMPHARCPQLKPKRGSHPPVCLTCSHTCGDADSIWHVEGSQSALTSSVTCTQPTLAGPHRVPYHLCLFLILVVTLLLHHQT